MMTSNRMMILDRVQTMLHLNNNNQPNHTNDDVIEDDIIGDDIADWR